MSTEPTKPQSRVEKWLAEIAKILGINPEKPQSRVEKWLAYIAAHSSESGIPEGGVTGQILKKKSDADYDTEWSDNSNDLSPVGIEIESSQIIGLDPIEIQLTSSQYAQIESATNKDIILSIHEIDNSLTLTFRYLDTVLGGRNYFVYDLGETIAAPKNYFYALYNDPSEDYYMQLKMLSIRNYVTFDQMPVPATDQQKAQGRLNIDAASIYDIPIRIVIEASQIISKSPLEIQLTSSQMEQINAQQNKELILSAESEEIPLHVNGVEPSEGIVYRMDDITIKGESRYFILYTNSSDTKYGDLKEFESVKAVLYDEQTTTDQQKMQARANIGLSPDVKTTDMTQAVGLGTDGKFYTAAGGNTAGVVASAYSAESRYSNGNLVIENKILYRALVDITTPEVWNPAHWEQTTIDAEMQEYMKYSTLVVTCLTQDGVTVTGQTVTIRKGDASGDIFATVAYDGQPVSIKVPMGFEYYISVSDTLPQHFAPTTASGLVNASTIAITLTYEDLSNITTYAGIQAALQTLPDPSVMAGNVEIQDTWTADNGTVYSQPRFVAKVQNVVGEDGETHLAAIMQEKWAGLNAIPFDAPENEEADSQTEPNALEGVYYAALDGTTFTKLSLNVGDPIPYSEHEKILHNGINFDNNMRQYGYNRWGHSFWRKYANSNGPAGSYEQSHVGDVLPSQAQTLRGYMCGCSPELLAAVKPIKVKCMLNNVTDGGVAEETIDTFWLPSGIEMYGSANAGEGEYFDYWKDATGLSSPSDSANEGRIQYVIENHNSAQYVRLRSACRSNSYTVWFCATTGQLYSNYGAYIAIRGCLACAIW